MLLKTKILSALFLFLSALPVICTIVYVVKTTVNTWQMKERLEQSSLQTITIPLNKIIWIEKGEEVLIEGKLFDVKSSTIILNEISLAGIFDTEEDKLIEDINAMEENDDSSSPVCSLLAQLFCPAIFQQFNCNLSQNLIYNLTQFPSFLAVPASGPFIGINTPPPNS